MLQELQDAHEISVFVVDMPPSLFGASDAMRRLAAKWSGTVVQVSTPTRPDLIGTREMIRQMLSQAELAGVNGKRSRKAFVVNRDPWLTKPGPARSNIARLIATALAERACSSAGTPESATSHIGLANSWLDTFDVVGAIPESDALARLSRVRRDASGPEPALCDIVTGGIEELAGQLLPNQGRKNE